MGKLQVFDPALCCSTGVCGTEVDQALVSFSADVDWAKQNGAQIERFNLAQQPMAFAENAQVKDLLERSGQEGLPLILLDGEIVLTGRYPTRDELAEWLDIVAAPSLFTAQVAELVAIGAAIACNCEPCFKYHYDQARKLGVSNLDMRYAVDLAQKVKDTPARVMLDNAQRYLGPATSDTVAEAGSCCVTAPVTFVKPASKCC
ncbi:MAG: arsenite efflux transporter metallochaperone ArsD [Gallionella sp.]|nr:arsenite efflux transporter metallochaperone ArsD [Gallionella sp.]